MQTFDTFEEIACWLWEKQLKRIQQNGDILSPSSSLNEDVIVNVTMQHEAIPECKVTIPFTIQLERGTLDQNSNSVHAKPITVPGRWKVVDITQ